MPAPPRWRSPSAPVSPHRRHCGVTAAPALDMRWVTLAPALSRLTLRGRLLLCRNALSDIGSPRLASMRACLTHLRIQIDPSDIHDGVPRESRPLPPPGAARSALRRRKGTARCHRSRKRCAGVCYNKDAASQSGCAGVCVCSVAEQRRHACALQQRAMNPRSNACDEGL